VFVVWLDVIQSKAAFFMPVWAYKRVWLRMKLNVQACSFINSAPSLVSWPCSLNLFGSPEALSTFIQSKRRCFSDVMNLIERQTCPLNALRKRTIKSVLVALRRAFLAKLRAAIMALSVSTDL